MIRVRTNALLLALIAGAVYLSTTEPTVSFWDCGELIATAYGLQIPHPPGAPLYQLIARLFCMLAGDDPTRVALWCNRFSALTAAATVALLYLTAERIHGTYRAASPRPHLGASIGALCYLFCHTVWFSAVESEVYSLAMLVAALMFWCVWRWRDDVLTDKAAGRWLLLLALLTGMGICVHLLTLLVWPAILVVVVATLRRRQRPQRWLRLVLIALLLGIIGLSPYLIVPIRAQAHPPLNFANPDSGARFYAYLTRENYSHPPLWPRIWREQDRENAADWSGGTTEGVGPNVRYMLSYQIGYMYCRYLCDNFVARENGYSGRQVWYVIPLLLALIGLVADQRHHRTAFVSLLLLFLTAGPLLNIYLNHPCYEPRERDYAYVLSFYALALWMGSGATTLMRLTHGNRAARILCVVLLLSAPVTLATGNWSDHNRSNRYVAHDSAMNTLRCCSANAILVTYGDNDTFPVWYVQQVERVRPDIRCVNINLDRDIIDIIHRAHAEGQAVYLTPYASQALEFLRDRQQLVGSVYQLYDHRVPRVDTARFDYNMQHQIRWHDTTGIYLDAPSLDMLRLHRQLTEARQMEVD